MTDSSLNKLYIDFETYYDTKQHYDLRSISIVEYIRDPRLYIQGAAVKLGNGPIEWLSGRKEVAEYVKHIDWASTAVVGHNIKFDGAILAWSFGVNPVQWIDTKGLAKAILGASVKSSSLKDVGAHLGFPPKGELKTNGLRHLTQEQETELAEYCKRDVEICYKIEQELGPKLSHDEALINDWTVRTFLSPVLDIDRSIVDSVYQKLKGDEEAKVAATGIDASVFASNQQFAELLATEGFTVPEKKNKNGQVIPALSLNDKEFVEMTKTSDVKLKALCDARVAVKQTLEQTRAKKLSQISGISKYCFDVIFSGAQQTHRFSGGNGCAGNPQNFRRGSDLRAALTAPPDHTLLCADFKNIELRILAFLSHDYGLMRAIREQEDLYCSFASKIYGRTITTADKKERMLGKQAVLGLGYGMGAEKFRNTVFTQIGEDISIEESKAIVDLYRETYPGVSNFWRICETVLESMHSGKFAEFPGISFVRIGHEHLVIPGGLALKYPQLSYKKRKRGARWGKEWSYKRFKSKGSEADSVKIYGGMLTENLCQALAGRICKEAILRLIGYGYPPIGQVHDELLIVAKNEDVSKAKILLTMAMTSPIPWWPDLPLEVEVGEGKNWLEAK